MTAPAPTTDRLILRGAISTAAGFGIKLGARLLFLFVGGRLFGAVLFGAFSLGVAVVEASVGLAGLSLKKTVFQMLDRNEADGRRPAFHIVLDAALLVLVASAVVAAVIMTVAALMPRSILPISTATALFWLAPMIAGQNLVDILLASTRWKQAIRYEVIGRSIVEPYSLLAGAVAARFAGVPLYGLIIGYWAGNITINAYALAGARRCFGTLGLAAYRPDPRALLATLRWLLPNTGADVLSGLYARLDLYLVGILLGERWSGIYSMAQQIRTPVRQVRQSFDGLLVPVVARMLARDRAATGRAIATAARFILAIQMPVLLAIVAIGAQLLGLFGPGFALGYMALVLLTAAETIQGSFGLGDLLFVYLTPGTGLRLTLAGFVLAIGGLFLLIPLWGITGAGAAMLVAVSLQALLRQRALWTRLGVRIRAATSFAPILAGAAGLAALLVVRGAAGPALDARAIATVLAGLGVYGAALALLLRVSGQTLTIRGFDAEAAAGATPAIDPLQAFEEGP